MRIALTTSVLIAVAFTLFALGYLVRDSHDSSPSDPVPVSIVTHRPQPPNPALPHISPR